MVKWGSVGLAASFALAYIIISIVFVPVYIKKCDVRKSVLISKESLIIWAVVIALVASTYWDIPLAYRTIALPFILCIVGLALKNIWGNNTG